jgi:hypothetical protein
MPPGEALQYISSHVFLAILRPLLPLSLHRDSMNHGGLHIAHDSGKPASKDGLTLMVFHGFCFTSGAPFRISWQVGPHKLTHPCRNICTPSVVRRTKQLPCCSYQPARLPWRRAVHQRRDGPAARRAGAHGGVSAGHDEFHARPGARGIYVA